MITQLQQQELMQKVRAAAFSFGDKCIEKLQDYTLDRLVWCIAAVFFCWTEIQNYHEYIFIQRMCILSGVGIFYCLKLGFFSKWKILPCSLATIAGVLLTKHLVETNYYAIYRYTNLPIGIFITVLLNLYVLVLYNMMKDMIKERRFPLLIGPSLILIFFLVVKQFSVYDYRQFYLYMLLGLLPFILMKKGYRTRSCVLNGIVDGLCIGFWVLQVYMWKHRPYNYSYLRYNGVAMVCTTQARIYLTFFAAWLARYVQYGRQKLKVWNGVGRVVCWVTATFILALTYLTGSRSAVLAMMAMTAVAIGIRYLALQGKWYRQLPRLIYWPVNCLCMGVLSLALFPVAYASVRYLPAYFDQPDYYDGVGYRLYSKPIQDWGENFGWNMEYDPEHVMEGDNVESPKYATFAESASHNLGRIIPGVEEFLEEYFREDLKEAALARNRYYYYIGLQDQGQYEKNKAYYERIYSLDATDSAADTAEEEDASALTQSELWKKYQEVIEKLLAEFALRVDAAERTRDWLSNLVLEINAEEFPAQIEEKDSLAISKVSSGKSQVGRGDSPENPWYTDEEYPGNGMALRMVIHRYALKKLNYKGHPEGSFVLWLTGSKSQPHAHNIFLIEGYNFGIPSMNLMALLFAAIALVGLYNSLRFGQAEYMLAVLFCIGLAGFGWFESGFTYKDMSMGWVCMLACFTDILRLKRKKKNPKGLKMLITRKTQKTEDEK